VVDEYSNQWVFGFLRCRSKEEWCVSTFFSAVESQFASWELTDSEQQVAVSILKGLSFQEIAALRETREKTVRQQAPSIYRKSGLSGRHELAAWFFEYLLSQT